METNSNAWIMLGENEPPGSTYKSENSSYQNLIKHNVYRRVNKLFICFFGTTATSSSTVPAGNGDSYTLQMGGTENQEDLGYMLADSKKNNPDIKVLATLGYGESELSQIFSGDNDQKAAQDFASNLVAFLEHYGMDGFDVDWESPLSTSITATQFSLLFDAIRSAFDSQSKKYYLTLSPAPAPDTSYLSIDSVNKDFDFINLQLYSGFTFENDWTSAGVNKDLLAYGAKFESKGSWDLAPYQDAQNAFQGYQQGGYKSATAWRLNSGDFNFEQAQQMLLFDLIHPSDSTQFDDTDIAGAAGNAPITSMVVRSGEVLNALQVTSSATFATKPLTYQFERHGGDSGVASDLSLDDGDLITEISGYTGVWFGWNCVLQITLKTENGKTYGPFGSMGDASIKNPFSQQAPSGQSIVAFKGSTVNVPLADGSRTDIIATLEPVFGTADYFAGS